MFGNEEKLRAISDDMRIDAEKRAEADDRVYWESVRRRQAEAKMSTMISEGKFEDIWTSAVGKVGDKHYPKGESKNRGEFLLIQALLYCELVDELMMSGVLVKNHG